MKFLVDHQLPTALVRFLRSQGHEATHVREIGLKTGLDTTIWHHAVSHKMVMITKDEDFVYLVNGMGNSGQLIWLRLGNCRNHKLIEVFAHELPAMLIAFDTGVKIVEVR